MASSNVFIVPSVSSMLIKSDHLKKYFPLWVDILANLNENRHVQQKLRSAINYLRAFENATECEIYIRQSKESHILLIVSGQLGFVIVPLTHTLIQISSKYACYLNLSRHHELASKFVKVQATVTDLYELIEKIKMNRKSREKWFDEPLLINVCNSGFNEERSSTNINSSFLHFQLLIDGLLHFPYDQTSRDKFFDLCKKEYQDNHQQLSRIKEFEELYVPDRALYWYSRHKFLYEMLNKALRVQNINVLFLYRFFIQDLYKQLQKLQQKQDQRPIRVYRGQYMSKQELHVLKESKGQFISMNSFLSTSLDLEISRMFIPLQLGNLCGVLLEIDVDPRLSYGTKPFANISSQSQFEDEQEILFMVATIFRLIDIRQENEINIIQMELCDGNYDQDMEFLLEHMQMENDKYHECFSFGHVLRTARMYDQAEQFYNRMLNELENDHPLVAELSGAIGLVKKAKGEIEISSQWLNKSLKKYEQMGDHRGIAKCLHNLANIHNMKGEINQAMNKYNQALNMFHKLPGNQDKSIANCYHNLGVNYFEQSKFTEAVQYYMVALFIRKTILPHTHPDTATTVNNIGNVCFRNGEYDRALQYFEEALDIFTISLPVEHPSVAQTYQNMGQAYFKKKEYRRSLIFFNRAASIRRNTLPPDHPSVHRSAHTIDYVKQKLVQLEYQ